MAVREPKVVCFGNFELDQRTRELRKHGVKIKLQQRPFQVLSVLLKHRGEIVSRKELQRALWPDGVFVDFDHSLNTAIKKLRDALGDTASTPRYIATVDREGYRFSAPVMEISSALSAGPKTNGSAANTSLAVDSRSAEIALVPSLPAEELRHSRAETRRARLVGITAACVLLMAGCALMLLHSRSQLRGSDQKTMIAVLPFENLTGDVNQEYFADGFTEEIITQLGRLDSTHLRVIARTSVMHYKNTRVSLADIARELGVQYILEGSIRRGTGKVRITAQLINAQDQTHIWARDYDRELYDLLGLQNEIALEIADEIQLAFKDDRTREARGRSSAMSAQAYAAYDLYLKGRYFWNKRSLQGFQQAVACFEQAIQKNPTDPRAYAGLADSYAMMSGYQLVSPDTVMPKARAAALKALQIDDSLAEAHTSLALLSQNYDWDWQTAEKEYRRAIQLNPNYATAHQWYAEFLTFQGRFPDALVESERARQLDPLSLIIAADNGAILYFARRYDGAIERFRAVLDMDPAFTRAHLVIAAYVEKGQFKDALADIEAWRRASGDAPWIWAWEAYVNGRAGNRRKVDHALERLRQLNRSWQLDPLQFLDVAYAGTSDHDRWLAWLESAYRKRSNVLIDLKVNPMYDPLRSDPRFQKLVHSVGLEQ
ncbi:MAG TPA: winged helix-turn-helix domain-containing protein [Terriglobales bacterium]|nr:winged helix-turn-helix domain-containing protein [Terriglobales bacterium]